MVGTILIVDDVATNRIVLKVKLTNAGYQVATAASGMQALDMLARAVPDLILLDLSLGDIDGIEICRRLRQQAATRAVPVIVVTANTDPQVRIAALEAGADDVQAKPACEQMLLARMRMLMRARERADELRLRDGTLMELGFAEPPANFAQPARIGLIAGAPDLAMGWRAALRRGLPHDRIEVLSAAEALGAGPDASIVGHRFDAFMIAADLDRPGDGLRLMSELRSRTRSRHAAICIALPLDDMSAPGDIAAMALDLGADDLLPARLSDPLLLREACLRLRRNVDAKRLGDRRRENLAEGLRLSVVDPLTGLYNRRYALPHLARIAEDSLRAQRDFAVMVLDMDRFKVINDTHGHAAGDAVLIEVTHRLRQQLRQNDLIARLGGEEFLVALPNCDLETAAHVAGRLRRAIEQAPISLPDSGEAVQATISIGLAMGGPAQPDQPVEKLMDLADRALMQSKAQGRNQVRLLRAPCYQARVC